MGGVGGRAGPPEGQGTMDIQTVRTEAFEMDCVRFGDGPRPFVILPGLSVQSVLASAEAVAAAYKPFTEDFTVWLFDPRKDLPPGYAVRDMSRDTAGAMRTLGLADACVFGASMGGMVAMGIAAEHPGLVRKLVLASTTARMTAARWRPLENWIALAKAGKAGDLYLAFGGILYPPDVFESLRDAFLQAAKTVTPRELERFVLLAEAARGFDASAALGHVSCPTLVVGSRDDLVLGADAAAEIAAGIPGAGLHLYDGCGHAFYDTAPDFGARMLEFLLKG